MVAITFLAFWLTLRTCPDTPWGRLLYRTMIELPAARLEGLTRGHVLIAVGAFTVTAFVLWLVGSEAARVMSMAAPDAFVWLTTFEVTGYVDALAAVVLAASSVRLRTLTKLLPRWLLRRRDAARVVRERRGPRPAQDKAANDDEDDAELFLIAA